MPDPTLQRTFFRSRIHEPILFLILRLSLPSPHMADVDFHAGFVDEPDERSLDPTRRRLGFVLTWTQDEQVVLAGLHVRKKGSDRWTNVIRTMQTEWDGEMGIDLSRVIDVEPGATYQVWFAACAAPRAAKGVAYLVYGKVVKKMAPAPKPGEPADDPVPYEMKPGVWWEAEGEFQVPPDPPADRPPV